MLLKNIFERKHQDHYKSLDSNIMLLESIFETKHQDHYKSLDSNILDSEQILKPCARNTTVQFHRPDVRHINLTISQLELPSLEEDEESMIGENDCCGYVDLDNTYLHVKHQASIDPTETISELSNWHIYDEIRAKGYRAVQSSLVPTNLVGHSTLAPRHHFDPDELSSIKPMI